MPALGRGEQGESRKPLIGIAGRGLQEGPQRPHPALDRGGIEQAGAVLHPAAQPAAALVEREGEVELGDRHVDVQELDGEARHGRRRERARQIGEGGLEERRETGGPLRLQLLDQPVEGDVLPLLGGQHGVAHPPQQGAEGGIVRDPGARHQGVDEEADQPLGVQPVAPGGGEPHREVVLAAQAGEQGGEAGQQGGEGGDPLAGAEPPQAAGQTGGEAHRPASPPEAGRRRARAVGGQLQHGDAGELLPPPGELRVERPRLQRPPLPDRPVGVAHRQRRQGGGTAGEEVGVEHRQLVEEDRHRPAVDGDVVEGRQQDPPLLPQLQQEEARHRAAREVERAGGLVA